ncbi:uncharacterized protein AMSG_12331 [Thecamonas trahens ATCC 50062]|uniref:Uncharacterized protein n=1 Tax=Thecamonas trahens ATCC 50062 TaxID=461836 RepID=A0A0L0DRK2_THETB|nr:hypothetical protein AMSG_12331 [Thecamonas trahens ATCC 50062]KNC54959.1 hypothetical protein AMSG_12331 [Thecamonas trahens ATCC 50062]|eukprot:XP_013753454.1 hypothetical protein AMSG_12331 [Thecamonas trahens ATCC 50062]
MSAGPSEEVGMEVELTGSALAVDQLVAVAGDVEGTIKASKSAMSSVADSRKTMEKLLKKKEAVVADVNSGCGGASAVGEVIGKKEINMATTNWFKSMVEEAYAELPEDAGAEAYASPQAARMMVVLKINAMLSGGTGVRKSLVQAAIKVFNAGIVPAVPLSGSEAGRTAAAMAPLVGAGRVLVRGEPVTATPELFKAAGCKPVSLAAKEALALTSGTAPTTAYAVLAATKLAVLVGQSAVVSTVSWAVLGGPIQPFDELVHMGRPHKGQRQIADVLRTFALPEMWHSEAYAAARAARSDAADAAGGSPAACLAEIPQVYGAVADAAKAAMKTLGVEINACGDSPMMLESGSLAVTGNSNKAYPALAAQSLVAAASELVASIVARAGAVGADADDLAQLETSAAATKLKERIRSLKIALQGAYDDYLEVKRALGEEVSVEQEVGARRAKATAQKAEIKSKLESMMAHEKETGVAATPRGTRLSDLQSRYRALRVQSTQLKLEEARLLSSSTGDDDGRSRGAAGKSPMAEGDAKDRSRGRPDSLAALAARLNSSASFGSNRQFSHSLMEVAIDDDSSTANEWDISVFWPDAYTDSRARLAVLAMETKLLVWRLTLPGVAASELRTVVLLTHSNYISTSSLIDLLVSRFSCAMPISATQHEVSRFTATIRPAIQTKVLDVIATWITNHYCDFAGPDRAHELSALTTAFDSMEQLAAGLGNDAALVRIARLRELQQTRARDFVTEHTYSAVSSAAAPRAELVSSSTISKLANEQVHPLELARQLTRRAFAAYKHITAPEFLKQAWAKDSAAVAAPNLLAAIDEFNMTTRWAVTHVLRGSDPHERAHAVCFLIDVANNCMVLRNYATLMAILSALGSVALSRLSSTFAAIPQSYEDNYSELSEFMSMSNNSKSYRETLKRAPTPFIPYLGVFLQDLVFIDDGNESKVGPTKLVNLEKERMTADVVQAVLRGRADDYLLNPVSTIETFINMPGTLDEDAQYARSLQLKPRGARLEVDAEPFLSRETMTRITHAPPAGSQRPSFDIGDNPEMLDKLFAAMTLRTYAEGEYIVREGEVGSEMFFVRDGIVNVDLADGRSFPLNQGAFFGEIALFLHRKRTASIWAQTRVEALVLTKAACDEVLTEFPHMRARFQKLGEARLNSDGEPPEWMQKLAKEAAKASDEAAEKGLLSAMRQHLRKRTFRAGEYIIREGDSDDANMYFISKGIVDFELPDGRTFPANQGTFFGEVSLFTSKPRSASVRAHSDVVLLALSKADCESVLNKFPKTRKSFRKLSRARAKNAKDARALVPPWMKELAEALAASSSHSQSSNRR